MMKLPEFRAPSLNGKVFDHSDEIYFFRHTRLTTLAKRTSFASHLPVALGRAFSPITAVRFVFQRTSSISPGAQGPAERVARTPDLTDFHEDR
jgi:hypothetical protein